MHPDDGSPSTIGNTISQDSLAASLSERIAMLAGELSMALKWDRPCISLAVYRSEHVRQTAVSKLEKIFAGQGIVFREYRVDHAHFDVALDLRDHPEKQQAIFMIDGLQWGGGRGRTNAYHALNMHREYLVERKIRSVFWLTMRESRLLPRHAPDFWAFRSNVVEFLEIPGDIRAGMSPLTLAAAYRDLGCWEDAIRAYRRALKGIPGDWKIHLEIAALYLDVGRTTQAARLLNKLSREGIRDAVLRGRLEQLRRAARTGSWSSSISSATLSEGACPHQ